MKKIYIAGKVTGLDKALVTEKFAIVKKEIEAMGFLVVNPIEVVGDWDTPWKEAMKTCITALIECDGAILLPDWTRSKGARLEVEICDQLGIPTFDNIHFLQEWNN